MYLQAGLYTYLIKQAILQDDYFKDFTVLDFKFIVICKNTLTPLVWSWSKNDEYGDVDIKTSSSKVIRLRGWSGLVTELDKYLKYRPKLPDGINQDKPNSILDSISSW